MLFSELLKNPCLHRPWPPRVMQWYVIAYLETSEYLLSGGGEGGRWEGFGGVTWFSEEKKGGRVNRRQQNTMMGGDYRD